MLKPAELRSKNTNDLNVMLKDLGEEYFKLKVQNTMGQLEKNHRLGELRKDIARVKTILQETVK